MRRVSAVRVSSSLILALPCVPARTIFWLTLRRIGAHELFRLHLTVVSILAGLIFGCAIVRVACLEVSWVLLALEFIPAGPIFGVALVFANAPGVFGVSLALPCIPALLVVICAVRQLLFDLFVVVFHLQFEEFTP